MCLITLFIYSLFSLSIYSYIFFGQKPCVSGVINILIHTYETEIQSASFYQTPAIKKRIVKKWEAIKIILV